MFIVHTAVAPAISQLLIAQKAGDGSQTVSLQKSDLLRIGMLLKLNGHGLWHARMMAGQGQPLCSRAVVSALKFVI
jgi:hypothetical protein